MEWEKGNISCSDDPTDEMVSWPVMAPWVKSIPFQSQGAFGLQHPTECPGQRPLQQQQERNHPGDLLAQPPSPLRWLLSTNNKK